MKLKEISEASYKRFADTEFKLFFEDFYGKKKGRDYYKTFSHKRKNFFFSIQDKRKIIGVVSLRIDRKVANIGGFVVVKGYRDKGVGSRLLDKCEIVARKHKCSKIWAFTLPTIKAFNFYKKKDYKEEARLKKHFGGNDMSVMSKFL